MYRFSPNPDFTMCGSQHFRVDKHSFGISTSAHIFMPERHKETEGEE